MSGPVRVCAGVYVPRNNSHRRIYRSLGRTNVKDLSHESCHLAPFTAAKKFAVPCNRAHGRRRCLAGLTLRQRPAAASGMMLVSSRFPGYQAFSVPGRSRNCSGPMFAFRLPRRPCGALPLSLISRKRAFGCNRQFMTARHRPALQGAPPSPLTGFVFLVFLARDAARKVNESLVASYLSWPWRSCRATAES